MCITKVLIVSSTDASVIIVSRLLISKSTDCIYTPISNVS